ncbi:phospho-N-acetylmuramoyl-pentapeptide-transferase [Candidatus Saganbacteria bacterium]|uniref:Phospho-N-acetylmuramoyl-pentapeptide-transferase n=1 Tax=Candidatus Saganbacteria bacterium TaxID=2575572 RepID=A0A9D6YVT5_UNCSA|nr:phospho-N-acetylmuramoyl-pentapeptide-transferase [Candidatus Saganbacteria bacterium]
MISLIAVFLSAAVVSLLATFPMVWLLSLFKLGQPVREEGPVSHRAKAGTPTMGGIGFVITIFALILILIDVEFHPQYLALLLLTAAFAAVGLTDDLLKVFRRQNLGLTFRQKIFLQIAAAAAFAIYMTFSGHNLTLSGFLSNSGFSDPYLYQFLLIFIIVGSANAANLTDGLNGLLAGTAGIAFLAFAFLSVKLHVPEANVFSLVSAGAILAFLYFNFPKAKVFMGDVGSLALGAALAGLAIILHKELRLMVIGGIFVIEALSVIIQVMFYKLFKRRIFKMAPLHHHFELMGWPEIRIVLLFWSIALILGIIGIVI